MFRLYAYPRLIRLILTPPLWWTLVLSFRFFLDIKENINQHTHTPQLPCCLFFSCCFEDCVWLIRRISFRKIWWHQRCENYVFGSTSRNVQWVSDSGKPSGLVQGWESECCWVGGISLLIKITFILKFPQLKFTEFSIHVVLKIQNSKFMFSWRYWSHIQDFEEFVKWLFRPFRHASFPNILKFPISNVSRFPKHMFEHYSDVLVVFRVIRCFQSQS